MPSNAKGWLARSRLNSSASGKLMPPRLAPNGNRYWPFVDSAPEMSIDTRLGLATFLPVRNWISCGMGLRIENSFDAELPPGQNAVPKRGSEFSCEHTESFGEVGCTRKSVSYLILNRPVPKPVQPPPEALQPLVEARGISCAAFACGS